jgi:hypothetical protein
MVGSWEFTERAVEERRQWVVSRLENLACVFKLITLQQIIMLWNVARTSDSDVPLAEPSKKRNEVTGWWRKLDTEHLHNLYSSASTIIMIKLWKIRFARHVRRMQRGVEKRKIRVGRPE